MSDDNRNSTIELNRRRVLAGLGTIGVASAGAGAGTMALFSDTESVSGNTVQAGTLNLANGDGEENITTTLNANGGGAGIAPGASGTHLVGMQNTGTIGGTLDVTVGNLSVTQPENRTGDIDPELPLDPEDVGAGNAEDPDYRLFENLFAATGFGEMGPGGNRTNLIDDVGFEYPVWSIHDWVPYRENNGLEDLWLAFPDDGSFDSFAVAIDTDDSGFADLHIGYQPGGGNTDSDGWFHKETTTNGYFSERKPGVPTAVGFKDVRFYGGNYQSLKIARIYIDESRLGDTFALGGHVAYDSPKNTSGWVVAPVTPGFDWLQDANGALASSDNYATVRVDGSATYRNLADMLDVDIAMYDDYASGAGRTPIASGKLSRILDAEIEGYEFQNEPDQLAIEWSLSRNVTNAVQGDTATFDVSATLTQDE